MSLRQTRRQAVQAAAVAIAQPPGAAVNEVKQQTPVNAIGSRSAAADGSGAAPRENIFLFWPNIIDFSSHYIHMYATLAMGGSETSHKNVDKSRSWLLNLYYTNKTVLFVFCALNELFFIGLYLLSFSSPLLSPSLLSSVSNTDVAQIQAGAQVNTSLLSQIFPNPYSAAALELARANKMDSFWPWVITGISFPVMAMKQFINMVQAVKASKWLAEGDLATRKAHGLPRKTNSS
ncbi:CDP-diacylglycerol--inositol 3-phosphatidyltransferase [Colletotrichum sidae]|uniref:CDP-diacylglycerol--inositol 3-phosphatidyltransferase n=1 Tax=Colletotrichum sidae TaxID=1347389 RepID=A0A4R8T2A3_9PEZI|nr:CDP-diacylglycerol--inositol 3-phosphatidyltransferase [Colletotrichum sidae]